MKSLEFGIDHPLLNPAKLGFNACVKRAIVKAIAVGSNEGSVSLKLDFTIEDVLDRETGEINKVPQIKYKSQFSVPLKGECNGELPQDCFIVPNARGEGYLLMSKQISMDDVLDGEME